MTVFFAPQTANAIRGELEALRAAGTLDEAGADLADRYDAAAALVDKLAAGMEAATLSGNFTALGLLERNRTLAEPLIIEAEKIEREAIAIERGLTTDADAAWQALQRPAANDAERALFADRQARLEKSDPVYVDAWLMHAARTGAADELLRAALTYPVPPLDLDGAAWKPIVRAALREQLRQTVASRVSPQGALGWRARLLHSLAGSLRTAAGNNQ